MRQLNIERFLHLIGQNSKAWALQICHRHFQTSWRFETAHGDVHRYVSEFTVASNIYFNTNEKAKLVENDRTWVDCQLWILNKLYLAGYTRICRIQDL